MLVSNRHRQVLEPIIRYQCRCISNSNSRNVWFHRLSSLIFWASIRFIRSGFCSFNYMFLSQLIHIISKMKSTHLLRHPLERDHMRLIYRHSYVWKFFESLELRKYYNNAMLLPLRKYSRHEIGDQFPSPGLNS